MRQNVKIHGSAIIDERASIGAGTSIWQNCIIQENVVIGNNCNIGANVFIEQGVKIGNGVKIKNNIVLYRGVTVEDHVFLGPACCFTNVINPRSFIDRKQQFQKTLLKKGATVGANATIVCGHSIGRYAMIGAGAVVTKDIADHALIVGNPGRLAGYVCECGCRLDESLRCRECGNIYISDRKKDGWITKR